MVARVALPLFLVYSSTLPRVHTTYPTFCPLVPLTFRFALFSSSFLPFIQFANTPIHADLCSKKNDQYDEQYG